MPPFPHVPAGVGAPNPQDSGVLRRCLSWSVGGGLAVPWSDGLGVAWGDEAPQEALPALRDVLDQDGRLPQALQCSG